MSKPELMSYFDEVLMDRNITMERIENFKQNLDNIGRMIDDKYLVFKTSGSTGNPAVVLYDKNNIDVSSAVYLQLKMPRQITKITVDVNGPESEIIKQLNDFDPAMLSGYPSNLSLLADFKEMNIHPDLVDFFKSKDLSVKIILSDSAPEANKVSGKFKHIYKDFD